MVSSPFVPLFGAVSGLQLPCTSAGSVPGIPGGGFVSPAQPTQTLRVSSVTLALCETPIRLFTSRLANGPSSLPEKKYLLQRSCYSWHPSLFALLLLQPTLHTWRH